MDFCGKDTDCGPNRYCDLTLGICHRCGLVCKSNPALCAIYCPDYKHSTITSTAALSTGPSPTEDWGISAYGLVVPGFVILMLIACIICAIKHTCKRRRSRKKSDVEQQLKEVENDLGDPAGIKDASTEESEGTQTEGAQLLQAASPDQDEGIGDNNELVTSKFDTKAHYEGDGTVAAPRDPWLSSVHSMGASASIAMDE